MDKLVIQKKFRFVMVICAALLFITIFTPTYIIYGKNTSGNSKILWMWTIFFGAGNTQEKYLFDFSWIAFIAYAMALIILIIALARKFITVDTSKQSQNGGVAVDACCMVFSFIALLMFIILPITKSSFSKSIVWAFEGSTRIYGWGVTYILAYIILSVMLISSIIVMAAEPIAKYKKIKSKNSNKE